MTRYHIAKSGKPAVCKAPSEDSCPLGGTHYKTKDEAEFALQLAELQEAAAAQAHAVTHPSQSISHLHLIDEADDTQACDHVGTGRTFKFDGGRMAKLCDRCSTIVGYATDEERAGLAAANQRRAQNPLNDAETAPELEVGRLASLQRRKHAEALNGEDAGLAVGARAAELRRGKAPSKNDAFLNTYSPEVGLRKLSDAEVNAHHAAIARYNAAMAAGDKPAIREATAHLQELGSPVAGYAWDPEGAERRLSNEIDRRVQTVQLVSEDLMPRLLDAEKNLTQLRDSQHPALDGDNKKRLDAKLAGVEHFRKQWAGKVLQAGSVDGMNEVLAHLDKNRKLTMTPESGGSAFHGNGWNEGLDLASGYVSDYLR